jgi:hypothetical protein
LNRASAELETIIAKALHRAPAGESALLSRAEAQSPIGPGRSVFPMAFCEWKSPTQDGGGNSPTWRRAM